MKEYIKPQTEAIVLSKEALMQNIAGSTNGKDGFIGGAKSNSSDEWDDEED